MKNENEITVKDLTALLEKMKKRLSVSNHSEQTIVNYLRAVEYLCKYTGKTPRETEIDEVTDYLYQLQYFKFRAWRTIKIYVAGLRWFYTNILDDEELLLRFLTQRKKKTCLLLLAEMSFTNYFLLAIIQNIK